MKKIMLLGAGRIGTAIAADLSSNHRITAVDSDTTRLEYLSLRFKISGHKQNIKDKSVMIRLMQDQDLIINAVPSFMGYETLKMIIEAGKNAVDISFFSENAFDLNALAVEKDVTAVVDCGIAPGLSNIILGYNTSLHKVNSFKCYVGGLPFERNYPFQYKAPFSPSDVIEEYTRPARIRHNGKTIIKPALSEPELLHFNGIGTLEAFNSDGLRYLLTTMNIPDMVEKTLRYPGHLDAIRLLRDSGFLSSEEINIKGIKIKPVDLSSQLLFDNWKLQEEEDEFTVLRIIIETDLNMIIYDLMDVRDTETGFSSMARTTGFTCTAVANLIAEGKFYRKGICPPEFVGMEPDNFKYVKEYLLKRDIVFSEEISSRI